MPLLDDIEGFVSGKLSMAKTMLAIVKLETKLASLTLVPLLFNIGMLLIVLTSLWVGLSALLGYGIFVLFKSVLLGFLLPFLVNIGLLIGLYRYFLFNVKNISFERTRAFMSQKETPDHEKPEKKLDSPTFNAGKKIRLPAE